MLGLHLENKSGLGGLGQRSGRVEFGALRWESGPIIMKDR